MPVRGMNSLARVVVPPYVIEVPIGCHSIVAISLNLSASVHNVYNKTVNKIKGRKMNGAYSYHLATH